MLSYLNLFDPELKKTALRKSIFIILMVLLISGPAWGQNIMVGPDREFKKQTLSLPYPFFSNSFGAALGFVHAKIGYPQKQASLLGTIMAGTKGSAMALLMGRDIELPLTGGRLFMDPIFQIGYFRDLEVYTDGNPFFPDERAGSNDSDKDNFIEGDGWDNFSRVRFKYLLPIGLGKDTIIFNFNHPFAHMF